jgi:hypothetical protein
MRMAVAAAYSANEPGDVPHLYSLVTDRHRRRRLSGFGVIHALHATVPKDAVGTVESEEAVCFQRYLRRHLVHPSKKHAVVVEPSSVRNAPRRQVGASLARRWRLGCNLSIYDDRIRLCALDASHCHEPFQP